MISNTLYLPCAVSEVSLPCVYLPMIFLSIFISYQVVRRFHTFLRPFNHYIIFSLQSLLSFQSSSINPFSPISPLIPSAQISLGLPRISNGLFSNFFFRWAGCWPAASTPNLEDQMIFDQSFLPLVLDTPVSNCKVEVLVLVGPGYFISPVPAISGEHSPICHQGTRPIEA